MNDQQVIVNGIDIDSGEYLVDDFTYADAVAQAQAARSDLYGETEDQLKVIESNFESQRPHMGPVAGIDARSLEQCGWGIIFAADDPDTDAIVDKLKPLLTRRAAQAGKRFKKYAGDQLGKGYDGLGYRNTQQRADHWLEAHGGSAHEDVDPQNVPYYLLIVGSPHRVPFRFQYELDIQYAVGRIHFDDLDDYRAYAEAVVEAETGSQKRSQSIAMFAPCNAGDVPTIRSSGGLAKPLVERFENDKDLSSWKVHKMLGDGGAGDASTAASKANLRSLLRKNGPRPAFLFTASHGVGMKNYDPSKRDRVGALVCQDWSGRSDNTPSEPPGEERYFSGSDVTDELDVRGLISFHFACFGAGAPERSVFSRRSLLKDKNRSLALTDVTEDEGGDRRKAPEAFLSRLPQRLLANGALAAVGHVDIAFADAFAWKGRPQNQKFHSVLRELSEGFPIGHAMDRFNRVYISKVRMLFDQVRKKYPPAEETAALWTATFDARNYIVVGDPAVRLNVVRPDDQEQEIVAQPDDQEQEIEFGKAFEGEEVQATLPREPETITATATITLASSQSKQSKSVTLELDDEQGRGTRIKLTIQIEMDPPDLA